MPPSGSRHAAQSRTISCQAGAITSRGLSPGHGSPATSQSEPSSGLSPPSKAPGSRATARAPRSFPPHSGPATPAGRNASPRRQSRWPTRCRAGLRAPAPCRAATATAIVPAAERVPVGNPQCHAGPTLRGSLEGTAEVDADPSSRPMGASENVRRSSGGTPTDPVAGDTENALRGPLMGHRLQAGSANAPGVNPPAGSAARAGRLSRRGLSALRESNCRSDAGP